MHAPDFRSLSGRRAVGALVRCMSVILIGVMLWGVHLGMTQGLLATMVADRSPTDLRGTAYGFST